MSRPLPRLLLRLLVLALVAFLGDRAGALWARGALRQSQFRFSRVAHGGLPAQILVLGDSRAVNGFYAPELTRRLGRPVMNLGYNGMSTLLAEAVLRDYLERNAAPSLLVLEVTNVPAEQRLLDGLRCYWADYPALTALARERAPRDLAATQLSHLYAFNGEAPLRALYYARRSDQDWINRYRMSAALIEETRREPPFDLVARPENLAALTRITRLARERGIPVRHVISPYFPYYIRYARNYASWRAQIQAAIGSDARIWDYSQSSDVLSDFADRLHLNDQGSPAFLARLERDGLFEPTPSERDSLRR